MQKIVIAGILFHLTISVFAQKNNPYNQVGLDYVESVKIISEDYNNGKIKDLTKETIEGFTKKI